MISSISSYCCDSVEFGDIFEGESEVPKKKPVIAAAAAKIIIIIPNTMNDFFNLACLTGSGLCLLPQEVLSSIPESVFVFLPSLSLSFCFSVSSAVSEKLPYDDSDRTGAAAGSVGSDPEDTDSAGPAGAFLSVSIIT